MDFCICWGLLTCWANSQWIRRAEYILFLWGEKKSPFTDSMVCLGSQHLIQSESLCTICFLTLASRHRESVVVYEIWLMDGWMYLSQALIVIKNLIVFQCVLYKWRQNNNHQITLRVRLCFPNGCIITAHIQLFYHSEQVFPSYHSHRISFLGRGGGLLGQQGPSNCCSIKGCKQAGPSRDTRLGLHKFSCYYDNQPLAPCPLAMKSNRRW